MQVNKFHLIKISLIQPGGKKQAWSKDGVQKIHTIFKDSSECIEQFDIKEGLYISRQWRKIDKLGRLLDWEFEIGENPKQTNEVVTDLMISGNQPIVTRHDSEGYFLFKITNMTWPENNYNVTVEDGFIVVRTANKKFFKKLTISDLEWQKLPLCQQFVKFKQFNNTLVIFYQKPPGVIALEKAAKQARKENIKDGGDGCKAE